MDTFRWNPARSKHLMMLLCLAIALVTLMLVSLATLHASPAVVDNPARPVENSSPNARKVITIGVGAALTGPAANLGWQEANSAQLAVNQINASGGIKIGEKTYDVAILVADSKCNGADAVTAANTLVNAGVVAVVGHTCSSECAAAQPIYSAAGVAMISPSCTNPNVTQQGYKTTFRTVPHDGSPAVMLAKQFRTLGLSKSAIVDSGYAPVSDSYANTFTALGGTITGRHTINNASEIAATLATIQAENPDVIVNLATFDAATQGQFSQTAHNLGMTNVVIGWHTYGNDEAVLAQYSAAAGAPAAENDYAAFWSRRFTDMPRWNKFLADYQAANFANEPNDPGIFGAFAYDAARILVDAIDRADSTKRANIRNAVAATSKFPGVVGTYQGFDTKGDIKPQWGWLQMYKGWMPVKTK